MQPLQRGAVSIDAGQHRSRFLQRRDALVEANMDLARSIARAIHSQLPERFDFDDLVQTGLVALLDCATRYRPKDHGGTPFSAWARPRIRGAILDSVRRPQRDACTVPPAGLEAAAEPSEQSAVERIVDAARAKRAVAECVSYLEPRQRTVLALYYGTEPMSFREVGATMGISRPRAQQLHADAIARLRVRKRNLPKLAA